MSERRMNGRAAQWFGRRAEQWRRAAEAGMSTAEYAVGMAFI